MDYEGLGQDDLANVGALNRAWLRLHHDEEQGLRPLPEKRLARLANAPFLLFSFREQDDRLWRSLLEDGQQQDLLSEGRPVSSERQKLQSAGLAFLWELARRNPYVARVVSGAPLHWCERIAAFTLVRVLDSATRCYVIEQRFGDTPSMHKRLLRRGGSAVREMRVFAQIGALQAMLTSTELVPRRRIPAAACRMPQPAQQVADKV